MQLQGPLARTVLTPLYVGDRAPLRRFDPAPGTSPACRAWSRARLERRPGYEVFPLGSDRGLEVWDAVAAGGRAARAAGLRPNVPRALERGITDIAWFHPNLGVNALEAAPSGWSTSMRANSSAGARCLEERARGSRRRTIGLVVGGRAVPVARGLLARCWTADGRAGRRRPLGGLLLRARAQHRDRPRRCRASATTTRSIVRAPDGDRAARVHPVPFV